jgi:hypothetical protein
MRRSALQHPEEEQELHRKSASSGGMAI